MSRQSSDDDTFIDWAVRVLRLSDDERHLVAEIGTYRAIFENAADTHLIETAEDAQHIVDYFEPFEGALRKLLAQPNVDEARMRAVVDAQFPFAGYINASLSTKIDGYYVLGDNRDDSTDSRNFGPVDSAQLRCRIVAILGSTAAHGFSFKPSVVW